MYQIEKNVPIPHHSGKGGRTKYPFPDMKVGESFAMQYKDDLQRRTLLQYASSAPKLRGCEGMKFTGRSLTEKGKTVVRIWRVK